MEKRKLRRVEYCKSKQLKARITTVKWINFINKHKNKYKSAITLNISNIALMATYYN
jgi:hypothetical protein